MFGVATVRYKLGKLPAIKNSVSFRLRDYLALATLPKVPKSAGHLNLAKTDHNMFGNDTVGDCTCADVAHATLYWNRATGKIINISTANVIALYSAVSGYNGSPETDNGANMATVATYHQKTGIQDESGSYHKIAAYLAISPGNIEELKQSIHLFEACSVGWELPDSAQNQFSNNQPWSIVNGATIEGGHDTLAIGYDSKYLYVITWGKIQPVEWSFVSKYMDEGIVKLSDEMLKNGVSLEGFNVTALTKDLQSL
jgi:hypothetical protein